MQKNFKKTGKPIIITSVNISGQNPITKISEIPEEIKNKIDFIIDSGKLSGSSSTIVKDGKIISRKYDLLQIRDFYLCIVPKFFCKPKILY